MLPVPLLSLAMWKPSSSARSHPVSPLHILALYALSVHTQPLTISTLQISGSGFRSVLLASGHSSSSFPLCPSSSCELLSFMVCCQTPSCRSIADQRNPVGTRTTSSPFDAFRRYFFRYNTLQTLGWYLFSAWWFSEVYVWSASKDANLAWISDGKYVLLPLPSVGIVDKSRSYDRPRLNERPIYLRSLFFMLALMQSYLHLFYDCDRLPIPRPASTTESSTCQASITTANPLENLKSNAPHRAQVALLRSLSMAIVGPFVYTLFLRSFAWSWSLYLAKIFWSLPRSSSTPPTIPPFHISLLFKSVTAGFLLVLLWELSDATFNAFAAQEPLKKGRLLTEDARDPNGSLLMGLRAKKGIPKAFAFWELHYVSQHSAMRRKSFFEDIDRQGGPTWSQLMNLSLDVVQDVNVRIAGAINPSPPTPRSSQQGQQGNPQPLPRLSAPLREGDIFTASPRPASRPEMVQSTVGSLAKSYGQAPSAPVRDSRTSPSVKQYLEYGVDKALTADQRRALTIEGMRATLNAYLLRFLKSPMGPAFRQTLSRRSAAIVLGTPYGDENMLLHAIGSLTRLAICSLEEDPYGKVQGDVAIIIRIFVSTTDNLETLKRALPAHWTDVEATQQAHRDASFGQVDKLLQVVRRGLVQLLQAFGPYADNLGLSPGEVRMARDAAGVNATEE